MNLQTLVNLPPWQWPSNKAGEIIANVLRDKNAPASDRVLAAELAGDIVVMDDNMADLLLSLVRDNSEPEKLRCKSAISLGPSLEYADTMEFDGYYEDDTLSEEKFNEVRESLRAIHQDAGMPKNLRRYVLEAAVRSPMDWHKKAIQTAYSSNEQDWVLTAVFCMGYVRGFEDQVLASLENENPGIFYEAVCAAGNWGIEAAWPYINELLNREDIDKALLIAAIDAAATTNPTGAVDILDEFASSDDEDIAEAAEEALFNAGIATDDLLDDDDDYDEDEDDYDDEDEDDEDEDDDEEEDERF